MDWIAGFRAGAREVMLQPRRQHGSARPIQERRDEKSEFFFFFVSTCLYLLVFNIFSIHQVFLDTPTLLLAQIHRVNRTLRNLLCDSRNPIEGHYFNNVHQIPVKTFSSLFIVTFMCQNYSVQCIESSLLFVRY